MSSKKDNVLMDVGETYSKAEMFLDKNKKYVTGVIIAILAIVAIFYGYKNWYIKPMEKEAETSMFMAVQFFEQDSLDKAINGAGQYEGLEEIANNYSGTKSANLAHYYLGMAYLKKGEYKKAISNLKDFSSDDVFLGTMAIGARGDANVELNNLKKAADLYAQASNREQNNYTTPMFLMKAAQVYEALDQYDDALQMYKKIKENYQESKQAKTIDKYIARSKLLAEK